MKCPSCKSKIQTVDKIEGYTKDFYVECDNCKCTWFYNSQLNIYEILIKGNT